MATRGRTDRVQIARAFGIPIYLHLSWLIVFGLMVWTLSTGYFPARAPGSPASSHWAQGLAATLLMFASILVHELGHAVTALVNGVRTRSITLFLFGGVAELERDPDNGRVEFWMAAAGPLVSLVLAGLFALGARVPLMGPAAAAVGAYLALMNLVLALFNLVPAFPLDGGRLLRGVLWGWMGKTRATWIAAAAGTGFAVLLVVAGVARFLRGAAVTGVWYILIGWFIRTASAASYEQVRIDEALRGLTVGDAMEQGVLTVRSSISVAEASSEHFRRTGYGSYPVVRGDAVVGLLGLEDVLRLSPEERAATSVQGAMRPLADDIVTEPDAPLAAAIGKMAQAGTARLLVLRDGRLAGLLTMSAVSRRLRMRETLAG